jgi:hypothetical protein
VRPLVCACASTSVCVCGVCPCVCVCIDLMVQMGFSEEEIKDSLVNQKYNDVMATYLLLDYRNSEVRKHALTHTRRHRLNNAHTCP